MKNIKGLINGIPLISLGVLILSYVNIHSYYSLFGINIYTYLEPSEVVLSFSAIASELFFLTICAGIYLFFNYMNYKREIEQEEKNKLKLFYGGTPSLILAGAFITFSVILTALIYPIDPFLQLFLCFSCTVLIPIYIIYNHVLRRDKTFRRSKSHWTIIFSFALFAIFIFQINSNEHAAISSGSGKYEVNLLMADKTQINTSQNFLYIGSTTNYHFFQNVRTKINLIIPKDGVKEERIKKIR